jgi:hypothetical protein
MKSKKRARELEREIAKRRREDEIKLSVKGILKCGRERETKDKK